jgi:hypothetical protein
MERSSRNEIATAAAALCPASFGAHLWLFYKYFSSHPTRPDVESGFVYQLNNHGAYVYVSNMEATGLALLWMAFFVGLFLLFIVAPKDFILPSPEMPRWITYVGGIAKTDLANPTPKLKVIFLCSLVFYVVVIWLAGPSIVGLFVSHGVVLHF